MYLDYIHAHIVRRILLCYRKFQKAMPNLVLWFVPCWLLASNTTKLEIFICWWRISTIQKGVSGDNTGNKTNHARENGAHSCFTLRSLLDSFGKMCSILIYLTRLSLFLSAVSKPPLPATNPPKTATVVSSMTPRRTPSVKIVEPAGAITPHQKATTTSVKRTPSQPGGKAALQPKTPLSSVRKARRIEERRHLTVAGFEGEMRWEWATILLCDLTVGTV